MSKLTVCVTWYRKEKWWPMVLQGLLWNRDNIEKVIIANDEEWGEWRPEAPGSGLTIQLLEHPHRGWGAGRVLNEAVKHVETPHFLHIDGDMLLQRGSIATSILYLDEVSLLGCRVYNTSSDAHLAPTTVKGNGRVHMDELVAERVMPDNRDFGFRHPLPLNLRHGHYVADTAKWLAIAHPCEEFQVDGVDAYFSMDYVLAARWMLSHGKDSFAYGGGGAWHLGGLYDKPQPEAECVTNKRKVRKYLDMYVNHFQEQACTWNDEWFKAEELQGGRESVMPPGYVERQRGYNATHSDGSFEEDSDERWGHIVELIREYNPTSVLDVGCRGGVSLVELEKRLPQATIVGVDIVPEFIAKALDRDVDARTGDMHHLPFDDGEFEWITCLGTFEHAYNVRQVAREFGRVARVGVYVTCDLRPTPLPSDYAHTVNVDEWRAVLEESGMKVVHEAPYESGVEFVLVRA